MAESLRLIHYLFSSRALMIVYRVYRPEFPALATGAMIMWVKCGRIKITP